MGEAKAILGMTVAAGLLLAGMSWLPRPGLGSVENIFTVFWLALAWISLAAFGREVWRADRLRAARRSRRERRDAVAVLRDETAAFSRQRERRLD